MEVIEKAISVESTEEGLQFIEQMMKSDMEVLRQDVFNFLHQSRLQSFEQVCPFLNTPIPYKLMSSMTLSKGQVTPISFTVEEQVTAEDKLGNELVLHPMINGQILPCEIQDVAKQGQSLVCKLSNKSGFFYLEHDFIDLWVSDKSEVVSHYFFQILNKANFKLELIFQKSGETASKPMHIEPLHYAYVHPNKRVRDELREGRFYTGIRLQFDNDFSHMGIAEARIRIFGIAWHEISQARLDKERFAHALKINYVPLINYQSNYAVPIELDGTRDSYPLLSEAGKHLSLLKVFSIHVLKDNGLRLRIYPHVTSDSKALSYDILRPCYARKIKNSHIMVHNYRYGEDERLQTHAAWFDPRLEIGKLQGFRFISRPVEQIQIRPIFYTECCAEIPFDMDVMHKVQYLIYQKNMTAGDMASFFALMVTEEQVRQKLSLLKAYLTSNLELILKVGAGENIHFIDDLIQNQYLNRVLQQLLKALKSMR